MSLTATVSPSNATGKVTFYDGTTVLETGPLTGGAAVFTTSLLASGTRTLKASYSGDATYASSRSTPFSQTVTAVAGNGFLNEVDYPVKGTAYSVALTDLNGDGNVDAIVGGQGVTILLGNGDGTFRPPVTYGTAANVYSVVAGDFNGDGLMDVLEVGNNVFNLWPGNGDGTLGPAIVIDSGAGNAAVVADFNQDGIADIALGWVVFLGHGDGTFSSENYSSPVESWSLAAADFNRDGKPDLVVPDRQSGSVSVFLGNGDGTFQPAITSLSGAGAFGVAVGDFNGDGKADIAVTSSDEQVLSVLLGNGDGTFQAPVNYPTAGAYPEPLTIGDFNGDGKLDVLVGNDGGFEAVLLGNGDGTLQLPTVYDTNLTPIGVAVADLNGDGVADFVTSGSNGAGNKSYLGVALGKPAKAATATTLSTLPNPSVFGQSVTLTATVSPTTATGSVTFFDGIAQLGSGTVISGVAFLTLSSLGAGSHSLTATYGGDEGSAVSTSPAVTQTVAAAPTTTTLTSSLNPSVFGQNVVFAARVSPSSATGTVSFGALGAGILTGGTASVTTSSLAAATYPVTAVYSGDANYLTSTSATLNQVVDKASTIATLTSSLNPSFYGQKVTLRVNVTPAAATGTLAFVDGSTVLATTGLTGGTATLTLSTLAVGQHSLRAVYTGNANFAEGISAVLTQSVTRVPTTTTLTSSPDPSSSGQSVTLAASVTPAGATGLVTFKNGPSTLGRGVLKAGVASFVIASLPRGADSLTAVYVGDADHAGSVSAVRVQTVQ